MSYISLGTVVGISPFMLFNSSLDSKICRIGVDESSVKLIFNIKYIL